MIVTGDGPISHINEQPRAAAGAGVERDLSRPKIAFVIDTLAVGGAERHLVRLLAALQASGRWNLSVYCLSRSGRFLAELENLGISVAGPTTTWRRSPISFIAALWRLYFHFRQVRPTIAHCYLTQAGLLGAVAARLTHVPIVTTTRRQVHGYHGLKYLEYRLAMAVVDRLSDEVIAVCEAARRQAVAEGTPPEKIHVVYNSIIPPPSGTKSPETFLGTPVFGTVASLHWRKGHRYLLDAIPALLACFPTCRFVLVGDGPERAALEAQASALRIRDHVTFLGARTDATFFMHAFDIFVLPALLEGLPNAVLEAMAAGLPVVATDVGGVPEVVENGVTGVVVQPGSASELASALAHLGSDHALRRRMGIAGRDRVIEHFAPGTETDATQALYRRLLGQRIDEPETLVPMSRVDP